MSCEGRRSEGCWWFDPAETSLRQRAVYTQMTVKIITFSKTRLPSHRIRYVREFEFGSYMRVRV